MSLRRVGLSLLLKGGLPVSVCLCGCLWCAVVCAVVWCDGAIRGPAMRRFCWLCLSVCVCVKVSWSQQSALSVKRFFCTSRPTALWVGSLGSLPTSSAFVIQRACDMWGGFGPECDIRGRSLRGEKKITSPPSKQFSDPNK